MNPGMTLLVGLLIVALAALIVWPRVGLWARWQDMRRKSRRVLIEDTLKHLYDYEYKSLVPTHQSLSGILGISPDAASELLSSLESLGLVRTEKGGFALTEDGRSYALRVVRMHRLWERYLADQTGVDEKRWHPEAEKKEHDLTVAQADALAAQMGHPRFDPHGDPIPTAAGDVPEIGGQHLTELKTGELAVIVHIEDEPELVYAQLVALGLTPGMLIRVLDISPERVRFEVEGNEHVLAPVVAANVTVRHVQHEQVPVESSETLDRLEPGESASVVSISRRCRGQQRRRLMDLGILPGTRVTAELQSASGDPTAYIIRGATIALRRSHAALIHVKKEGSTNE